MQLSPRQSNSSLHSFNRLSSLSNKSLLVSKDSDIKDSSSSSKTTIIQKPYLALFMYILLLMVYYISEKFSNDDSLFKKYEDMVYLLIILLTNFFLFNSLKRQSSAEYQNQFQCQLDQFKANSLKRHSSYKYQRDQQPNDMFVASSKASSKSLHPYTRGQQMRVQHNLSLESTACQNNQCTKINEEVKISKTNKGVSTDQYKSFSNYHYSFLVLSLSTWGVHMLKKKYPNKEKQLLMVINLLYSISFSILWMMFSPTSILLNYLIKKAAENKGRVLQLTFLVLNYLIHKFVIENLDIKEDDPLKFLQSQLSILFLPLLFLLNYLKINIVVFSVMFTLIHLIFVYDIKTKKTDPVVEKEDPVVEIVEKESETNYIYMKWFVISIAVIILYQNMYKKKKKLVFKGF